MQCPDNNNLDVRLAKAVKSHSTDPVGESGHYYVPIFHSKNGRQKAIRFSTLNSICEVWIVQPGDILDLMSEG